ncbi:hypothetical protein NKR23_g5366 [Pleurostoma richardsiae]|uniref:Uncharacterized protein n=1 Tax=Pleurostoma richardsiae TaxID=41990 RepID=A0AA38RZX4_9PEZI|nr:hypothetical protein NKR23_g5366 [Pleurostoma richardsiae]
MPPPKFIFAIIMAFIFACVGPVANATSFSGSVENGAVRMPLDQFEDFATGHGAKIVTLETQTTVTIGGMADILARNYFTHLSGDACICTPKTTTTSVQPATTTSTSNIIETTIVTTSTPTLPPQTSEVTSVSLIPSFTTSTVSVTTKTSTSLVHTSSVPAETLTGSTIEPTTTPTATPTTPTSGGCLKALSTVFGLIASLSLLLGALDVW